IRFIVNTDGRVSDVIATTMKGTNLAKVSLNAIKNGPKWIPASQNEHTVAAYRLQPVTLTNPDKKVPSTNAKENKQTSQANTGNDDKKIFVKLEQSASFPGGNAAWLKYIIRNIQKNSNQLISDKYSQGDCVVRFIVNKDGSISDLQALTKKGTKLADVAVNAIKQGPKWIPGKQNGHVVNSYVEKQVRFIINDQLVLTEPR
ncbi:MAG: energy transducer TonB, partial [Ginsengibacter sp.]